MTWGVIVFPGSNDNRDSRHVLADVMGADVRMLWHKDNDLKGVDAVVLPGGFSYGDYLRAGAIARISPVMEEVARFANAGGPVLGICNGFQVLCEAGLLPGALIRNSGLRFVCRDEAIEVANTATAFTASCSGGEVLRIPVKHGCGCYVLERNRLEELEGRGGVVFRYADTAPNGSVNNIAGVCNERGNVVGLMPHPEHAVDPALGMVDGRVLFESAAAWAVNGVAA